METAIVVFTRDLRLHDNPALHQACQNARQVVPLFVVDPALPAPPNRARFLAESLTDLRHQLRQRQADLIIPPGDLRPASGDHYKVFTPYWRVWRAARWRPHCPAPETIQMPGIEPIGTLPPAATPGASPALAKGGETEGRRRFLAWRTGGTATSTSTSSWPTPTWPATPATGSGWPAPATTPAPTGS